MNAKENLYLTIYNTPPGMSKINIGVDLIRAEDVGRVKSAFEEVERIRSGRITRIADISKLDLRAYKRETKLIDELIMLGKDNFVYFDPFYDVWRKKAETPDVIFQHTKITKPQNILFVGIDMNESNSYINMLVDMIGVHYGFPLRDINIINAHIRNPIDRNLMLNLIHHKLVDKDEVVFLYPNQAPLKKDARMIFAHYPTAKMLYSIEDRIISIDSRLVPRVII